MGHAPHPPGPGGGWATAVWVTAAVVAIASGLVAMGIGSATRRDRELCRPGVAFREWKAARAMPTGSDDRTRSAARALVGCDRPLIGLTRGEIRERLGESEGAPVDSPAFAHWALGGGDRRDSSADVLVVRFAGGRAAAAHVTE